MYFLSLSFLFTKLDLQEIIIATQNIENKRENTILVTTFYLPLPKPLKGNDLVTELALLSAFYCLLSQCKTEQGTAIPSDNQMNNVYPTSFTLSSHTSNRKCATKGNKIPMEASLHGYKIHRLTLCCNAKI